MATSGSTDYNRTVRQLCEYAIKKIGIVGLHQPIPANALASAQTELEVMLKGWQQRGPNLWRRTSGSVTLVAATSSYTLSPRPFRVVSARYRDANGRDTPMRLMTSDEYDELPLKTSTGVPTNYFVDYQRASAVMYVWPVPATVTTQTIRYTYQRRIEDMDAEGNDIDILSEHFEAVGMNLAARLADNAGRDDEPTRRVIGRAEQLYIELMSADREPEYHFVPGGRDG